MPLTHDELVSIRDYIEFTERKLQTTEFSQSVLRIVNREINTRHYGNDSRENYSLHKEIKNGR